MEVDVGWIVAAFPPGAGCRKPPGNGGDVTTPRHSHTDITLITGVTEGALALFWNKLAELPVRFGHISVYVVDGTRFQ